ncbi:MAG: hypothetical protein JXB39_09130 [Deltaproteobacteria bacterium]|nr:hypothetical protein [Deltaproteobacteria bacterium]
MNPDLVPLVVGVVIAVAAVASLAAFTSRRTRWRNPSAARALATLQEVFEPEVEHRVEAGQAEEEGRGPARRDGDAAGGPDGPARRPA